VGYGRGRFTFLFLVLNLSSLAASFPAFNSTASATNFVFVFNRAFALSERSSRFLVGNTFCGFVAPLLKYGQLKILLLKYGKTANLSSASTLSRL
jgi:hypothetical protein